MQEFVTKKSLTATLRLLPRKGRIKVKTSDFKIGTARAAASRLKKEGIIIQVSEKGMIDEYEVIRL